MHRGPKPHQAWPLHCRDAHSNSLSSEGLQEQTGLRFCFGVELRRGNHHWARGQGIEGIRIHLAPSDSDRDPPTKPEQGVSAGTIDGVRIVALRKIADERGTIMHGVRSDNALSPFGEVYFKRLYEGVVNGFHVHEKLELNYICLVGMIKLVLCDLREASPTRGVIQEVFMGDDHYVLTHIPPGIANGMKGMTAPWALVCNVASHPHDPALQYRRIDPHSGEIPYSWDRKDF